MIVQIYCKTVFSLPVNALNYSDSLNRFLRLEMIILYKLNLVYTTLGDIMNQLDDIMNQLGDIMNQLGYIMNQLGDIMNKLGDIMNQLGDILWTNLAI